MRRQRRTCLTPWSHISAPGLSHLTWKPEEGTRKQALRARGAMPMPWAAPSLGHKQPRDPGSISDRSFRLEGILPPPCNPPPPIATPRTQHPTCEMGPSAVSRRQRFPSTLLGSVTEARELNEQTAGYQEKRHTVFSNTYRKGKSQKRSGIQRSILTQGLPISFETKERGFELQGTIHCGE